MSKSQAKVSQGYLRQVYAWWNLTVFGLEIVEYKVSVLILLMRLSFHIKWEDQKGKKKTPPIGVRSLNA